MPADNAKEYCIHLPPLAQAPPFVHAALQGSDKLPDLLAEVEWTPENVEYWWRLVVVLARQDLALVHPWTRPESIHKKNKELAEIEAGKLMERLGHALPKRFHDIPRLKGLLGGRRQILDTDVMVAFAQMGAEGFWDWREHHILFHRNIVVVDHVVDAFAKLPVSRRLEELDKAWDQIPENKDEFTKSAGNVYATINPSSIVRYLRRLHDAAPEWVHWKPLLDLYVQGGSTHPNVVLLRAQLAHTSLKASLPGKEPVRPPLRPRM